MIITLDYFLGLLNSDSSFFLTFKKDSSMNLGYRINPQIQITQTNSEMLKGLQKFFQEKGIKTSYNIKGSRKSSSLKNQQRADSMQIEGIQNVGKALELIKSSSTTLLGLKYYDFLLMTEIMEIIMKKATHNSEEGRRKIIDLRAGLHKPPVLDDFLLDHYRSLNFPPREEKPIPTANRKTREEWEANHNLGVGSSVGTANLEILKCHKAYIEQCYKVKNKILTLAPDQVSGIMDGRGCFTLQDQKIPAFTLSFATGSEALFEAFTHYLNDKKPVFTLNGSSVQYRALRKELIANIKTHVKQSTVLLKNWFV